MYTDDQAAMQQALRELGPSTTSLKIVHYFYNASTFMLMGMFCYGVYTAIVSSFTTGLLIIGGWLVIGSVLTVLVKFLSNAIMGSAIFRASLNEATIQEHTETNL